MVKQGHFGLAAVVGGCYTARAVVREETSRLMSMEDHAASYEAERAAFAERDRDAASDGDSGDLSGIAQSDSLRLYLREIARIPLLAAQNDLRMVR